MGLIRAMAAATHRLFFGFLAVAATSLIAPAVLAQPASPGPPAQDAAKPPPPADQGPSLELAPEHTDKPAPREPIISLGAGELPEDELIRGGTAQRFRSAAASLSNTSVGGYGEIHLRGTTVGRDGERNWVADIPRLVLFVAHDFNNTFRVYTELEVEHGIACSDCPGAVEMEQAYVDWKIGGDLIALRAGLVLVPMGIINQWHEPPVFHGVVRPRVDTVVIPSTWRELGIGVFGQPIEEVRFELYGMTGFDPLGWSAGGVGGGRQNGGLAKANGFAVAGRVEVEPLLGAVIGLSGYFSEVGGNGDFYFDGEEVDAALPVIGWAADARWRRWGLEWRFVFAEWRLPESAALMRLTDAAGQRYFNDPSLPVPTLIRGAYVEAAYDVLHPFGVSHQLLPFARLEHYNTQAAVPEGYQENPAFSVREYTFGASYRPIQQVVAKVDYQLRNRKLGYDETQLNFGVGFMY